MQNELLKLIRENPALALEFIDKELAEKSLYDFTKQAWSCIESGDFTDGWHIQAMCEHLEAINRGEIKRLLINIPPRMLKTSLCSIIWPSWVWAQRNDSNLMGPQVNFLCGSYGHLLAMGISLKMRRLITSNWYKDNWGNRFSLTNDQNTKGQYDNDRGGSRIATSVGGSLLGIGGNILIADDPHNTESVESEAERTKAIEWFKELSTTRLNRPKQDAIVVVMQRLHEEDVSGYITQNDEHGQWCHLMLPARHEISRHCITSIGWEDPRTEEGELLEPSRMGEREIKAMERELGPYMAAGRLQQSPIPKGGSIVQREWWNVWPPEDMQVPEGEPLRYPAMEYIIAVCDTAYTQKKENDPSACIVLGVFRRNGLSKVMLMEAWEDRLELNGLINRVVSTCRRRKVDAVVIEGKASGKSVAQEIRRLCSEQEFMVYEVNPETDKVARLHAVVPLFSAGCVYAPDKKWADMVINQVSSFPKAKYDDLTDCVSMGLNYLRKCGIALLPAEGERLIMEASMYQEQSEPLYDV